MFVAGKCKKCGGTLIFNIEGMSKEEVETRMERADFGHCAVGFHVELGKMADYYKLDWSTKSETEDEAREKIKEVN